MGHGHDVAELLESVQKLETEVASLREQLITARQAGKMHHRSWLDSQAALATAIQDKQAMQEAARSAAATAHKALERLVELEPLLKAAVTWREHLIASGILEVHESYLHGTACALAKAADRQIALAKVRS